MEMEIEVGKGNFMDDAGINNFWEKTILKASSPLLHMDQYVGFIDPLITTLYIVQGKVLNRPQIRTMIDNKIQNKDIILMPINIKNEHWYMMVYWRRENKIFVYDSAICSNNEDYYKMESNPVASKLVEYGLVVDSGCTMELCREYPQQEDSTSCGVRCCLVMAAICSQPPYTPLNPDTWKTYNRYLDVYLQ